MLRAILFATLIIGTLAANGQIRHTDVSNDVSNGHIRQTDVSPSSCKDLGCNYECSKAYDVTTIGDEMFLAPTSGQPSSCSGPCYSGTGTVSGDVARGTFPDGTTFLAQGNGDGIDVIVAGMCHGKYTVTSGEVLSVTDAGGGAAGASPSTSTGTSENCKCSCCKGNWCDARLVASYHASSSSACDSDTCRSRFSDVCPAEGESGSVMVSYSEYSSSSPTMTSGVGCVTLMVVVMAGVLTVLLSL